jgi:hypothetical protein
MTRQERLQDFLMENTIQSAFTIVLAKDAHAAREPKLPN